MPRPRLPYLQKEITRHGSIVWYFRRGKGPRVRVRGEYGSAEFLSNYQAAIAGGPPILEPRTVERAGTLAWLVERYQDSLAWNRLAPATRRQRELVFDKIVASAGDIQAARVTTRHIAAGRDTRAKTPFAAKTFLKAVRGLFQWAAEAGHVPVDPTIGVKAPVPRTPGYHSWTEDEVVAFEVRWPIGTRERLALALLLFTGLRRGDVARLGRQHVKDGIITFRTTKTCEPVVIPILPELQTIIDATPMNGLPFVATADGKHFTAAGFGNWFGDACRAAGVDGRAHGLRKAGASRRAENGATEAELRSLYGWSETSREPGRYTRAANRAKLAGEAANKLRRGEP